MKKTSLLAVIGALLFSTAALAADGGKPDTKPDVKSPQADVKVIRVEVGKGVVCDKRMPKCIAPFRITQEITNETLVSFIGFLASAQTAGADSLYIEMNTPGGNFNAGVEMSRLIEAAGMPSICVVDGEAESMGMYILESCSLRVMTKRSSIMAHRVQYSIGKDSVGETLSESMLLNMAHDIGVSSQRYIEQLARRMKLGVKQITAKLANNRDWHIGPAEALKVGAVDMVFPGTSSDYFEAVLNVALKEANESTP